MGGVEYIEKTMGIIDNDEMPLGETRDGGRKSQTTLG